MVCGWKNSCFILSERSHIRMVDKLLWVAYALCICMLTSLLVDEILLFGLWIDVIISEPCDFMKISHYLDKKNNDIYFKLRLMLLAAFSGLFSRDWFWAGALARSGKLFSQFQLNFTAFCQDLFQIVSSNFHSFSFWYFPNVSSEFKWCSHTVELTRQQFWRNPFLFH